MLKKFSFTKTIQSYKASSSQKNSSNQSYGLIDKSVNQNLNQIKNILGKSIDVKYREFEVYYQTSISVFICFIDGLVNEDYINVHLVKSLMEPNFANNHASSLPFENVLSVVKKRILTSSSIEEICSMDDVIERVLSGETVIFIDGYDSALLVSTQGFESRNVEQPETESNVRGSREGFNEVLKVNTALVRRKINNPNLVFESMKIGKQTKTNVRIGYIEGIANQKVVEEVKDRLNRIDTDIILESGYIEQYIEDNPYSIFPTIANSEKPDKVAAKLLEGRIAIFCDGTPFVLSVPHLFVETLQASEDYYSRPYLASLMRLLRIFALFLTVGTPALFVAVASYHQEMVPSLLLTTMAAAEEKVPFPVFIEALMLTIVFELLREAGVRMPRPVGSAISIVGALVIGEAAVTAGLVSAPMVIVVALTAITGFVVTALSDAVIIMRFFLLFLAAAFGFYGILMGTLIILGHMCSLRSFGSPYLAPVGPIILSGLKDSVLRMPLWLLNVRPLAIEWRKSKRQGRDNKPEHPKVNKGEGQG
ncbi:spore germination protein [Alkalihalobacillus deserti]|uniref:spore germination protein n=1 Tax=Alkalihalobacillus deserti TaxID=2879466 RepID=UPI001D13F8B5|nr:spore germination protein [Alkalihalobacillus deserti]